VGRSVQKRPRLTRRRRAISVRFATPSARGRGTLRNLRRSGLFVASRLLPRPLERVRIAIGEGTPEKVEIIGTVRWTSADRPQRARVSGFGVQIDLPNAAYHALFESLLVG
jgi:hypothetical protein